MLSSALAAFLIVMVLIVIFSRLFKKVLDSRRQKVVVLIASIVLFIGCLLFCVNNLGEWTPLRDFSAVIGETSAWMILYHVLVLATYVASGFAVGCGFLQVTQTAMDTTKDSDMSMGQKRATGRVLRVIEYYFMVVVSVMLARVLLDIFGAIHANPAVELVLNLMVVWPFVWLILGLFLATLKFWRDRKFNTDFSLKRIQKFMAVDKVYLHRVLLVFWFVMGTWVFFLMEFFTAAYPGLTVFSLSMFAGYFVNKEPLGFS